MRLIHEYLFVAMWLFYIAYWWGISRDVKATERTEPSRSRIVRLICFILVAALFLAPKLPVPRFNSRFLPQSEWGFWGGAIVTAIGLLFSVWARKHLGVYWSQAVTVKQDHKLIQSGPYALVRHPIYSGLSAAFLGCAIALGQWRGLVAVSLVVAVLWHKLKLEETWMREQFGDTYRAYANRVPVLVPFIP